MPYEVNGAFGEVRHIHIPMGLCEMNVPFQIRSAGWHRCNDKYCIQRENGFDKGHLFLFSITNGGCIKFADRIPISLPAASVTWIPPNCKHSYYTKSNEIWELYWLHIEDAPLLQLDQIFRDKPFLPLTHIENICREFESMICEKKKNAQEFMIESSRRISFIYHFMLQESYRKSNGKTKGDELVQNIIRDMEKACHENWNLPELSGQYYLSVPQLIRRFKSETGMTPYAYLMIIRLQTAEMYLRYTQKTVDEISSQTGFSSTSNFILQFRNYYGTTPQKYRGNF